MEEASTLFNMGSNVDGGECYQVLNILCVCGSGIRYWTVFMGDQYSSEALSMTQPNTKISHC